MKMMKYTPPNGKDYSTYLIRPMTENGEERPIVELGHVLDAFIVAGIVFFSVLGGDAALSIYGGEQVLLTVDQVVSRAITAGIAFGMTFFAQWARYRGIKVNTPVSLGDSKDE